MPTATRHLLAASLALLGVTAVTGALAGLEIWNPTDDSLHGAAGTQGALILGVLAIAVLLFAPGRGEEPIAATALLAWIPIVAVGLYVIASWTADGGVETAAAALALGAVGGFLATLASGVRHAAPLTVPRLAIGAALVILATGLVLDLAVEIRQIGDADWFPFGVAGARSPSVAAFSILAGMAAVEWKLAAPSRPATTDTWGLVQVALFVAGWLTLLAGAAADNLNLLVSNVMFHAIAVAVFLARLGPRLAHVRWTVPGVRWFGVVILYLAAHVGLLAHVAVGVAGRRYLELAQVPEWLTFAVDHVVLVGVGASVLLGLALRPSPARPAADHGIFYTVHVGLVGFILGLVADLSLVSRFFAAVLGLGMILGAIRGALALVAQQEPEAPVAD